MQFAGGKSRQSKKIAELLKYNYERNEYSYYIEPFCGAISVISRLAETINIPVLLSDKNQSLITMWKALVDGWEPPFVTREMYLKLKDKRDPLNPLTAYAAYGLSFGGVEFSKHNNVELLNKPNKNSTRKKRNALQQIEDLTIGCGDYRDYEHMQGALFYLDPPYFRTNAMPSSRRFDSEYFWEWTRKLSKNNTVIVTEFVAPKDFVSIYEWGCTFNMNRRPDQTVTKVVNEQIFVYDSFSEDILIPENFKER